MTFNIFKKSINILVVSFLGIMAFIKGPFSQVLIISAFFIWVLFMVGTYLYSKRFLINEKFAKKSDIKESSELESGEDTADTNKLVLHFNYRITDKLRQSFPSATWKWCEEQPIYFGDKEKNGFSIEALKELAQKGGNGRIKIWNAEHFNYCDIVVDEFARLQLNLIKIVPLEPKKEHSIEPSKIHSSKNLNENDWYNLVGRHALQEIITELNSKGNSSLTIHQNGEIFILDEDNKEIKQKEDLKDFPEKNNWDNLLNMFTKDDLKCERRADSIKLSW